MLNELDVLIRSNELMVATISLQVTLGLLDIEEGAKQAFLLKNIIQTHKLFGQLAYGDNDSRYGRITDD
jgi:hypothetical protein